MTTPTISSAEGSLTQDQIRGRADNIPLSNRAGEPELSIIILGYREGDRLFGFIDHLISIIQSLGITFEIILVANYWEGTDDRTPEVAKTIARNHQSIKVVARPKTDGMMGWDMRSGLEQATGRKLAVIDGDGQFAPMDIVKAYEHLRDKNLALCQTYRIERADGFKRLLISKVYNLFFRALFPGIPLHDINAKPKVMTREAYQSFQLTSKDWFIDAEIVLQARRNGYSMGEIPSVFGKRGGGKSYVNGITVLEFLKNIFVSWIRETRYRRK